MKIQIFEKVYTERNILEIYRAIFMFANKNRVIIVLRSVIVWETKIYYDVKLLVPAAFASGRRPVVKIIAESLSKHDEKPVLPTPLNGIGVGKKRWAVYNTWITHVLYTEQLS
jgi:hypothetical protein